MDRRSLARSIGEPPNPDDKAAVARWMRAVHQIIVAGEGFKGGESSPDRYLKLRDTTQGGVKSIARYGFGYSGGVIDGGSTGNFQLPTSPGFDTLFPYSSPVTPTDLVVVGGMSFIFLEWKYPPSYFFVSNFEVWRAEVDDLGAAVRIAQPTGALYTDEVGTGSPVYYYWVRAVSTKDDYSDFNATNGTQGQTVLDPAYVLEVLNGQITATQLNTNLNEAIALTGENKIAIENEVTTRQGLTDDLLYANWSVKTTLESDGRTYVAGFGLSHEIIDELPVSTFLVKADQFAVGSPGVDSFALTIGPINGITTVGISSANIIDLSVTNAAIANLAADKLYAASGTIADAVIGTGHIDIAKITYEIKSVGFDAGNPFRWIIDQGGRAEFYNVKARGDIEASNIRADRIEAFREIILNGKTLNFPVYFVDKTHDYKNWSIASLSFPAGWADNGIYVNPSPGVWHSVSTFVYTSELGSDGAGLVKLGVSHNFRKHAGSQPSSVRVNTDVRMVRVQTGLPDVEVPNSFQTISMNQIFPLEHTFTWDLFDQPASGAVDDNVRYYIQVRCHTDIGGALVQMHFRDTLFNLVEYVTA